MPLILGIKGNYFTLSDGLGKKKFRCGLNAEALARMFKRAKYNPMDDKRDLLMFSSSMNWPQDSGAPRHFHVGRVDRVVKEAIILFLPENERAKVRANLFKKQKKAS